MLTTFWAGIERGYNGFHERTSRYAASIKCPALLLYAASDEIVSPSETMSIFRKIGSPDKKLVRFDGVNHQFLINRDEVKWSREVSQFLGN